MVRLSAVVQTNKQTNKHTHTTQMKLTEKGHRNTSVSTTHSLPIVHPGRLFYQQRCLFSSFKKPFSRKLLFCCLFNYSRHTLQTDILNHSLSLSLTINRMRILLRMWPRWQNLMLQAMCVLHTRIANILVCILTRSPVSSLTLVSQKQADRQFVYFLINW